MVYELALRDIKIRYRRPLLGFLWMLIIPLVTAFVYKILFSDFMHTSSGTYPFFIHLLTALIPWTYFSSAIQASTTSVMASKNIFHQVGFPKYLIPFSTVCAGLINFLPGILVLVCVIPLFGIKLSVFIIALPLVVAVHTCLIAGISFVTSCLQVVYRDTEYVVQLALLVLFFLTPGVYTIEEVIARTSPGFSWAYMFNPLVGLLTCYRITLLGGYLGTLPAQVTGVNLIIVPLACSLFLFVAGYRIFARYENRFSDYLNV